MSIAQIEKRLELLEKAEAEYKTQREMLADAMANDSELVELEEKMREAKRRHLMQKEAVMNEPENRKIAEKMKDTAIEIKDTKKLLADELVAYFMKNQSFEYVSDSGLKRRIAVTAKFARSEEE
jgi:CRISPR/Cas system-associated exonuclease Cas4 (RecB family)